MKSTFRSLVAACLVSGFAPSAAADPAPALPGFGPQQRSSSRHGGGLLLTGGDVGMSSPVVTDVDGAPGNEVVVAGSDGLIHVHRADGSHVWTVATPNAGCGAASNRVFSSPAVAPLFGDGVPHVVIGYGGFGTGCDGGVLAVRGTDGAVVWNFSLKKFARRRRFKEQYAAVFGTPAVADTDGDGRYEIGFGGFDRNVYLLNADGSVRWYYTAADTVFSSPAFADVDGRPGLEMIIGTDISKNPRLRPPTKDGGFLYAFRTTPAKRGSPRFGFRDRTAFVWSRWVDQVLSSSPVVAEVDPSSEGPEVVIGSGCYFPERTTDKRGRWVKVFRLRDGKPLATLDAPACMSSTPAVGDLDGDGVNEIIATVNGAPDLGGDGKGRVVAWKASRREPIWTTAPADRGRNDAYAGNFQSPVVADLDGNGSLEVVSAHGGAVSVLEGSTGRPLTCQNDDCEGEAGKVVLLGTERLRSTPAVADVDGDGRPEVVIGGGMPGSPRGALYAWTRLSGLLGSSPGTLPPYAAPWPMHRGGPDRKGVAR